MKIVNVLWTGGWDSTFRIVELSRENVIIQPVYVLDPNRKSSNIEINTMKKITAALNKKDETKAQIKAPNIIKLDDIAPNDEITEAYNMLCRSVKLGSQYDWLARLAINYDDKLEIGIEKPNGEFSGCIAVINKYGELIKDGNTYVLAPQKSTRELRLVFQNLSFPICMKTEIDMLKYIKSIGYEDVMSLIWFCHSPIKGKPCGFCRPCQQKMDCEMAWLLPDQSQSRYRRFKYLQKINNKLASFYAKTTISLNKKKV